MEIDINNYESVLIDYFDGSLNALEVAEVLLFLEQHPEIKNEFEAFGTLPVAENIFVDERFKLNLKKLNGNNALNLKNFDELIIAQIEGDCNEQESIIIDELIAGNKSLIKLKHTFQETKLLPDLDVNFPNKQSLKRKEAVIFYLNRKFAAAASLLLLASLVFLIYRKTNNNIDGLEIVQTKPNVIETNSIKEVDKLIEPATENKLAQTSKEQKFSKNLSEPIKINKNTILLSEVKPPYKNIKPIPIKAIASIETSIAVNDALISGAIIPLELIVSSEPSNEKEFLTLGNFMKKKIIERGKDNLIENEKPINTEELALDPITVASAGAGILEKTTGKKVFLSRSFDKSGSVKSYIFAAGDFKFERIK